MRTRDFEVHGASSSAARDRPGACGRFRRRRPWVVLGLLLGLASAGCAGTAPGPAAGKSGASAKPPTEKELACRDALQDVRVWCTRPAGGGPESGAAAGVIHGTDPSGDYRCLDARLRVDQYCY